MSRANHPSDPDGIGGRRFSRKHLLVAAAGTTAVAAGGAIAIGAGVRTTHASGTADNVSGDNVTQILIAALIAEDLATTFYYNGLTGAVIQDPNLAGHNGTANNPNYEQTDTITTVYNTPPGSVGGISAVQALTPFLTSGTGPAYSFATALAGSSAVIGGFGGTGNPPTY